MLALANLEPEIKLTTSSLTELNTPGCWSLYYLTFFLCHVVAMSSTCYVSNHCSVASLSQSAQNPILYGWLNSAFKQEFSALCSCILPSRSVNTAVIPVNYS